MKTTVFRPSSSPMRWPAVFALLLLAVSHLAKAQAPPGCSAAQFQADSCQSQLDGVCDAGTTCNLGTDCFDCDPCHSLRYQGCEACTAAGCQWCGRDAVCFSPSTLQLPRSLTCSASDFVDTCTAPNATTNEFSDPFYDAASWLFDLINIKEVWQSGITGAGIGIRINDLGVDASHPEFTNKFDTESSCEIYTPVKLDSNHSHGTACAALAAASGNSGCSVGIAPNANLSSCRVIYADQTDPNDFLTPESANYSFLFEKMKNMHISSNSYGGMPCSSTRSNRRLQLQCPFDTTSTFSPCRSVACATVDWSNPRPSTDCEADIGFYCQYFFENDIQTCTSSLDFFVSCDFNGQDPQELTALVKGVTDGRDGKGIVYVHAAGNSYGLGTDVNFEGTLNSRLTMSVGAVEKNGGHARYSESGAPLFISAPGGDIEFYTNNIVASAGGQCKEAGVGTSYAAPVVAGVIALMLQVNPALTWRDVQGILAYTSQQIKPEDPSWKTNAAGFHHSYLYGFGLVDASAAVNASKSWARFAAEIQITADSGSVNMTIPDYPGDSVVSTVTIAANDTFVTESTVVYLDLTHPSPGDLEIVLVSPAGTESLLTPGQRPTDSLVGQRWKLMTVRNWGESVNGNWTLRIVDKTRGDVSSCLDLADWSIDLGAGSTLDCDSFSASNACFNGTQGPNFRNIFNPLITGISDPSLADANGVAPAQACCDCGGGVLASTVKGTFVSWRLVAYGHDQASEGLTSPSSPVVPATSGAAGINVTSGAAEINTTSAAAKVTATSGAAKFNFRFGRVGSIILLLLLVIV